MSVVQLVVGVVVLLAGICSIVFFPRVSRALEEFALRSSLRPDLPFPRRLFGVVVSFLLTAIGVSFILGAFGKAD